MISQEIAYNVFKYFPKNRIITNTYKTLMNEYNITNLGNEYSTEIALANVNNPWEKRDPELNDRIHSLTDANLLNLYDNVNNMSAERRGNYLVSYYFKNIKFLF